jgi:hypothetical protein
MEDRPLIRAAFHPDFTFRPNVIGLAKALDLLPIFLANLMQPVIRFSAVNAGFRARA